MIVAMRLLNATPFDMAAGSLPGGRNSNMMAERYPPGCTVGGTLSVNRIVVSTPGCATSSTGLMRSQGDAVYGNAGSTGVNCGVPSFDRDQSAMAAWTLTGSRSWLVSETVCVVAPPAAVFISMRSGVICTDTCCAPAGAGTDPSQRTAIAQRA